MAQKQRIALASIATMLSVCGLAHAAQVQQVAFTTDNSDPQGWRNVEPALATDGHALVLMSSMRLSLFTTAGGSPLVSYDVEDSNLPFKHTDLDHGRFFDSRAELDPIHGRLWMLWSEDNVFGGDGTLAKLHLAVNKNPALFPSGSSTISTLSDAHWWFYTGKTGSRTAFDMSSTDLRRYQDIAEPAHPPFQTLVDQPSMVFDERAVIVNAWSFWSVVEPPSAAFIIIPTVHSNGNGSLLDGEMPNDNEITLVRLSDMGLSEGGANDFAVRYYAVQEPYEQLENASFFIAPPGDAGLLDGVRLTGLYYDEALEDWAVQQYVIDGVVQDMDVPTGLEYHYQDTTGPRTPEPTWNPQNARGSFMTAVMVLDASNEWKIFAVHAVAPDDGGSPDTQTVLQWYVIDPDLASFQTTSWEPSIEVAGRFDSAGDRYLPAIGVTPQGVAMIEYTYSSETVWPQVRRAFLNSSYTAVASDVLVQAGPSYPYTPDGGNFWGSWSDMQADPLHCGFWSVHTLAHVEPQVSSTDARDIWLFNYPLNCQNANLNFDAFVDAYDLALFYDLYAAGARRVDMDTNGTTDSADEAIFLNAYQEATQP